MSQHETDILRALRGAIDALPDVVYCLDEHGAVLHLGGAADRLYGKPVSDLLVGGGDFRLGPIDPGDRPRVEAAYRRLKEGRRIELTYNIRRADGVVGTVRERTSRKGGRVQGIISAVRADAQLALPLVVRDALEQSPQFFAMLDVGGRVRWASGAFERHLGLSPSVMLGESFRAFVHREDLGLIREAFSDLEDEAPTTRYVECRVGAGEAWRWVAWLVLPWPQRGRAYAVGIDVHEQKVAARALERAEAARLATYDGLWDVDLITGEIQGNARLYGMLGYAEGEIELRYDNWLNLVHPDDRERVGAAFEEHLWGEAPMYQVEHQLLRKDGTSLWVLARGQVVLREGGFTPTRMVGSYTDITERKLVEGALSRSEERARCIVDAVTVPMVITRLADGGVLFANDHARLRFGPRVDEPGDFYLDSPHRAGFIDTLEHEGHVSEYEARFTAPDGGPLWMIIAASLIEFDGEPAALATFSDITERRRAEEAIRDRNQTLQLILRTTSDGIWDWDLRTDAVQYSARWKEMLGYAPDELADTAETWRALIHPEDRPVAEQRLTDHLRRGIPFEHTSRYFHKDGALRWILVRGHALRDPHGNPVRIVGNHTDITEQMRARDERRRMETRLQNAQRLESMGVMAKGVAHDFNNLLMAILGNAELGLLDAPGGTELRQALDEICSAARQANELCNQLLAYAGEGDMTLTPVDVGQVVRDMRPLLEASVSRKAHLDLDCDRELPAVRGDAGRLRQVVANVVLNASDALGGLPGTIRITTGMTDLSIDDRDEGRFLVDPLPAELYVYVEIEDDGSGIEPELRGRIFDPFFTTRDGAGRGLGLGSALGIMRGHGGTIEVESAVGEGSTFRLLFPIVRQAAPSFRPAHSPPPGPIDPDFIGEGLVLFVDDRSALRGVALKWLESAGFEVALAEDGREAVQLFASVAERARAVVLDLTMPELDGPEVLGILRSRRPHIPALLMSGFGKPVAYAELGLDGPVEFLAKPFDRAQLLGALERLLREGDVEQTL